MKPPGRSECHSQAITLYRQSSIRSSRQLAAVHKTTLDRSFFTPIISLAIGHVSDCVFDVFSIPSRASYVDRKSQPLPVDMVHEYNPGATDERN